MTTTRRAGFIGLGLMGQPMAATLVRAGHPLTVWNRSAGPAERLAALGARPSASAADVFAACDPVFLMLKDGTAIDTVLGRRDGRIQASVAGCTVVQLGTESPDYSAALAADLAAAGARYLESPVSGSRIPAEQGALVAMVAGPDEALRTALPYLTTMCRDVIPFGAVPAAAAAKLAVNLFLITMVTGLAESVLLAQTFNLNPGAFARVLDGGPMASEVSRIKVAKLLTGDHTAQAAAGDVLKNCDLIGAAADRAGLDLPLMSSCGDLFAAAVRSGHGLLDMSVVIQALADRAVPDPAAARGG
jgi:3-hydroxyisobutyrate dehydrogenase